MMIVLNGTLPFFLQRFIRFKTPPQQTALHNSADVGLQSSIGSTGKARRRDVTLLWEAHSSKRRNRCTRIRQRQKIIKLNRNIYSLPGEKEDHARKGRFQASYCDSHGVSCLSSCVSRRAQQAFWCRQPAPYWLLFRLSHFFPCGYCFYECELRHVFPTHRKMHH